MENLNRKMAKGGLWMGGLRLSVRVLGLISTVILARLLVPADFGIVAMAASVIAFLELATAFSFDIPLIQNRNAERRHFDSAWTLNVLFYAALTLLLLALAKPAADFYQEARLVEVIYVLAFGFFVKGFENIGVVLFRKELDFRKDFLLMLSKKLAGFCITIPLAFVMRSYWALIAGMVVGNLLGVLLTYLLHPYRPRFSFSAARELMNFSKWLILNNAISFFRMRSPTFVIGRLSGTPALGLFTLAFELSTMPTTELVAPINRAVFPGYSKLSGDLPALRASYFDVLAVIALIALPAGFGLSAIAVPLIDTVLGAKWSAAAPLVSVLAIFGGLNALLTNTGSVYNAIGKPHLITFVGSINVSILLTASIGLALKFGPMGVAVGYLATTILIAPFTFHIVCREIGARLGEVASVVWRPLLASLLMHEAMRYIAGLLASGSALGSFSTLLVLVSLGGLIYTGLMVSFWLASRSPRSAEYRLVKLLFRKLRPIDNAVVR